MSVTDSLTLENYLQIIVANHIHISATALLVYDTLLTMGREVTQIWRGGFVGLTVLYYTTRYPALANRLMVVLERIRWPGQSGQSCTAIMWLDALFLIIAWCSIAAFSGLRAYALGGKRLWLLALVLCLGLALPATEVYQLTAFAAFVSRPPRVGCDSSMSLALDAYQFLATGARASAIASDLVVLVITVLQTRRTSSREDRNSLTYVLFKDGSIYFAVLCLFNVFDIILLQLAVNGAIADLVTVLSVILVSRFLLRLREIGAEGNDRTADVCLSSVEIDYAQSDIPPSFIDTIWTSP